MQNFREKLAKVLTYIYGTGIAVALFAGAISFLGYLVALIVGGQTAKDICEFIYKKYYPIIVYISSVTVLLGLVKMYVAGEKTLVPPKKKKKEEQK